MAEGTPWWQLTKTVRQGFILAASNLAVGLGELVTALKLGVHVWNLVASVVPLVLSVGYLAGTVGLYQRERSPAARPREVMTMRRYLLVLDMDLLAADEKPGLEPISHLVALREQEPCEVVVLSLAGTSQTRLPALELLPGASTRKLPVAPRPDRDISAAAEHRMNLAVRHLKTIGCPASGIISDEDVVTAVRREAHVHHYDQIILATGRQDDSWLARVLHLDPIHKLRRRWGNRLIVFPV